MAFLSLEICHTFVFSQKKNSVFMIFLFSTSWLKDWKLRADRDERKSQDKKREEGSYGDRQFFSSITSSVCCTFIFKTMTFCVVRFRVGLWRGRLPGCRRHFMQHGAHHRTYRSWKNCCGLCVRPRAGLQGRISSHVENRSNVLHVADSTSSFLNLPLEGV